MTCKLEVKIILHVEDTESYMSTRSSGDFPCRVCRKLRVSLQIKSQG